MNKLVEKIEALKELLKDEVCCEECNDATIEGVIDIIQAEFAEMDKPDCDGYWWLRRKHSRDVIVEVEKGLARCQFTDGYMKPISEIAGTWIKAIVPAKDGD